MVAMVAGVVAVAMTATVVEEPGSKQYSHSSSHAGNLVASFFAKELDEKPCISLSGEVAQSSDPVLGAYFGLLLMRQTLPGDNPRLRA